MKSFFAVCFLLFTLVVAPPSRAAGATNDIPVTTSSREARDLLNSGLHFMDVGRAIEARKDLLKAIAKDPGFTHAYFYLSLTALSPEEFKETIAKGVQSAPGKSEGEKLLLEINQTFINNDAAKRMELAKSLTAKYPKGPRAWMRLGFTQGAVNQNEAARMSWTKALELDPGLVGTHYALAFSYLFGEPKDFEKAKEQAEACIKLEPKEAKGYEVLGDVFRAKNELEKAREAYSKAEQVDPSLSVASLKKGHIDSFLGRFDEARHDYDKGIAGAENVNKVNYAVFKAFTYVHAGQPKVALEELQKLVTSADSFGLPKDQVEATKIATLTSAFTIALHSKLLDDATGLLSQITKLTKDTIGRVADADFARQQNANLLLLEGQLAAFKGDYRTAQSKAEENRKLMERDSNPRKLEGYFGVLALLERLQGNYAKAVEYYRKADLTILYVKYQFGLALEGAGNQEEAKKILKEVSQWNFNTADFALVRKDAARRAA